MIPTLSITDYFNQYLPIELTLSLQFILENQLNQDLLNISSNVFFQPNLNVSNDYRVGIRQNSNWDILPLEWRIYFESIELGEEREKLLIELANLKIQVGSFSCIASINKEYI